MNIAQFAIVFYAVSLVLSAIIITCAYSQIKVYTFERLIAKPRRRPVSVKAWEIGTLITCLISLTTPLFNTYVVIEAIKGGYRGYKKHKNNQ